MENELPVTPKEIFIASSKTCGPCSQLKNRVEREGLTVDIKYFEDELDLFIKHGIKAVPRLIIVDGETVEKIQGQDDIIQYLKDNIKN